jgi:cytidylate kinase
MPAGGGDPRHVCALAAGKSTLAQQLAARLNLPNVLQTDIIYQATPCCMFRLLIYMSLLQD